MTSHGGNSPDDGYVRFRLVNGTVPSSIPNLDYMLQLMACLEAIHSALRLGTFLDNAQELAPPHEPDRVTVWFVCAGWCAEAFRLLKVGERNGTICRTMLHGTTEQQALWDRIIAKNGDGVIGKIHRIRDKYFGHFDREVIRKFLAYQDTRGAREPFFVGTKDGRAMDCRFMWPTAACLFDLHGDPVGPHYSRRVGQLLDSLAETFKNTTNLLQTLLESWLTKSELDFQTIPREGE